MDCSSLCGRLQRLTHSTKKPCSFGKVSKPSCESKNPRTLSLPEQGTPSLQEACSFGTLKVLVGLVPLPRIPCILFFSFAAATHCTGSEGASLAAGKCAQNNMVACIVLEECTQQNMWRFPEIRGTFFGIPIIRTIVFGGLYWGPPILGNYHVNKDHSTLRPSACAAWHWIRV